jgi:hypothetical protein
MGELASLERVGLFPTLSGRVGAGEERSRKPPRRIWPAWIIHGVIYLPSEKETS